MAKETIEQLVEGGKATAAPPLGPALGPMGVNIGEVVKEINKKTEGFKGMKVPVKIIVDRVTKQFEIKVGTPPASALIKKEAGVEKGSGTPNTDKIADILIEQIIKIAKMKEGDLLGKDLKQKIKEIIGTCNSMGILVEGVPAKEAIELVNKGEFDKEIKAEKTELTAEEMKKLEEEKARLKIEIEKRREEFVKMAKDIITGMAGQTPGAIKAKLRAAKIPQSIIEEVMPSEGAVAAAGAAAPAAGAKPEAGAEKKAAKKE
jgi:large subunit ribosomal protein L11